MGAEGEILLSSLLLPSASPPVIVGFQPAALVDHVARVDRSLLERIPGDRGGSQPVVIEDLNRILVEVNRHTVTLESDICPIRTIAGGSITNTIRGLSVGFGITCGMIGACGDDEKGALYVNSLSYNGVDLSRLRVKKGSTGQCACLVDTDGNRTMRPCLSGVAKLQANEMSREDFKGSRWLLLRFVPFNLEPMLAAIRFAKEEGLMVSMDLASFEMVRDYKSRLLDLLEAGYIDLCFANEDEAKELTQGEGKTEPETALEFLANYCKWTVITLGPKGCIAKHGKEVVRVPATGEAHAVDATGAGDLFASGFLYGLVKGLSLEDCCKVGSCSGGSVIRALGGEVRPENWQWMHKQLQAKGLDLPGIS